MIKPTVHMNGTSAEDLLEQYRNARSAVLDAIVAVGQTQINGRDTYPQGVEAVHRATAEHCERIKALQKIADEMIELAEHVMQFVKE
jgi:hypothetical protein